MTSIFDRWTDLDPALALRRIEAAHGSQVFDNYAYLDPQRAIKQIESALSIDLDDVAGVLSFDSIEDAIDEALDTGGGGGGYVAKAVHFDGATWLDNAGLVSADSGLISYSLWVKAAMPPNDDSRFWDLWIIDPANFESGITLIRGADDTTKIDADWNTAGGSFGQVAPTAWAGDDNWHHIFGYADLGHAAGLKTQVIYLDGVPLSLFGPDTHGALTLAISGIPFTVPDNTLDHALPFTFFTGDQADVWIAPGVLETDITIFRDPVTGKPNDPSGFPSSAVLLSGDATTFATNQGTGGPFVLTGTLTNATTSPSDDAGAPDWVPANAKIYIDLVNDRAWTETDGEVAINTLLGTDPNTENAWQATAYDPANLSEHGYFSNSINFAIGLIGTALSKLLEGATTRIATYDPSAVASTVAEIALLSGTGNHGVEFDIALPYLRGSSWGGSYNRIVPNVTNSGADGAKNVLAFTLTPTRADLSLNGVSAVSDVLTTDDFPVGGGDPLLAALIYLPFDHALQSITIYDALPSTAGLSALSETGVTNTAPTGISVVAVINPDVWAWADNAVTVPTGFTGATTPVGRFSGIDPQGNSTIITITNDDSGKFSLVENDPGRYEVEVTPSQLDPGTYNFTLRATDPGGLYVEQEFTITVTA